jgi:hypothetical protein
MKKFEEGVVSVLIIFNILFVIFLFFKFFPFILFTPFWAKIDFATFCGLIGIISFVVSIYFNNKTKKQLNNINQEVEKIGQIAIKMDKTEERMNKKYILELEQSLNNCRDVDFVEWMGDSVANIPVERATAHMGSGIFDFGSSLYKLARKIFLYIEKLGPGEEYKGFDGGGNFPCFLCVFMIFCEVEGLSYEEINNKHGDFRYPLKLKYKNGEKEEMGSEELARKNKLFGDILKDYHDRIK